MSQTSTRPKAKLSTPKNATWFFNTGVILREQGRYREAIANDQKALEVKATYPAALMNLGLLLVRTGQDADAVGPLSALIELDPAQVGAYLNLGNALQNLGRPEEAIAQIEDAISHDREAIRIQPDHAGARRELKTAHAAAALR